uniref:Uncharacterized protein n=1 Tax=Timema bartmani TaxID=61472 RepID=A0A7R9ERM4_9NEOP|nr:unnamed protein product [Timema bartmani]
MRRKLFTHTPTINPRWLAGWSFPVADRPDAAVAALTGNLDPSVLAAMDKDALKKQIENMKYQATMERWPLSKSIAATYGTIRHLEVEGRLFPLEVQAVSDLPALSWFRGAC